MDPIAKSTTFLPANVPFRHEPEQHPSLIRTFDRPGVDQAIDTSLVSGIDSHRRILQLQTPSGIKPVIILTDQDPEMSTLEGYDHYLPHYSLPEIGHVWSGNTFSTTGVLFTGPVFSIRTKEQMKFCKFYNSSVLVRLVCKVPLVQAQSFWVSRSFLSNNSDTYLDEIGFSWTPSKQNEIFVLMPWASLNYVESVSDSFTKDIFGSISIRPLSTLISHDGASSPLIISAFFAPYKMDLYVPIVVLQSSLLFSQVLDVDTISGSGVVGTITLSSPAYISLGGGIYTPADLTAPKTAELSVGSTSIGLITVSPTGATVEALPTFLDEGSYPINATLTDGTLTMSTIDVISFVSNPASFAPSVLKEDIDYQLKEIPDDFIPSLTHRSVSYSRKFFLMDLSFNNQILDDISKVSAALLACGLKSRFETKVINQKPNQVECRLYLGGIYSALVRDKTVRDAKRKLFSAFLRDRQLPYFSEIKDDLLTDMDLEESVDVGEYQIFEYAYNQNSPVPAMVYGKQGDHSIREDSHWTKVFSAAGSTATIQNISFDLSNPSIVPPFVALREYSRHLLKYKFPLVKIQIVKNPFSSMLLRVINGTVESADSAMQLPGIEWDPTNGDLMFEPYWTYQTPGATNVSLEFTIYILNQSVSVDGYQIVVYINTSNMEYFHYRDYDLPAPTMVRQLKSKVRKEFVTGTLQGLETITEEALVEEVSTDSSKNLEPTSVTLRPNVMSLESGHPPSERKYHFCFSLDIDTSEEFGVGMAICHKMFPKFEVNTAKKYHRYQGRVFAKITCTSSYVLATNIFVCQADSNFTIAGKSASTYIRMFPHGKFLTPKGSAELPLTWRQATPYQTPYYGTLNPPQMGYLFIVLTNIPVIPEGQDPKIKVVLEVDTSELTYSIPSIEYLNYDYPEITAFPLPLAP